MWTQDAEESFLIYETVPDRLAQSLLFLARVNLELYQNSVDSLREALDTLNFHNFARANSCHMTEGIFGADKHRAEMETARVRVVGFLLSTITAGHRFIRCVIAARGKDRGADWKPLSSDLQKLEKSYRVFRHSMEHLEEAIARGNVDDTADFIFTPDAKMSFRYKKKGLILKGDFDFSKPALEELVGLYHKLMKMLECRKEKSS